MHDVPRIGAIYPNDAWVDADVQRLIDEFRCFLPAGVEMVTAGTMVPNTESSAEMGVWLAENGDIEEAARRLTRYSPDCFAYFCTTASFIRGVGFDEEISDRIARATGLPATTTSTAMVVALKSLGVKRVALASPYMPDVEAAFIAFLEGHGFEVVNSVALNLPDGHSIVPPERIQGTASSRSARGRGGFRGLHGTAAGSSVRRYGGPAGQAGAYRQPGDCVARPATGGLRTGRARSGLAVRTPTVIALNCQSQGKGVMTVCSFKYAYSKIPLNPPFSKGEACPPFP